MNFLYKLPKRKQTQVQATEDLIKSLKKNKICILFQLIPSKNPLFFTHNIPAKTITK